MFHSIYSVIMMKLNSNPNLKHSQSATPIYAHAYKQILQIISNIKRKIEKLKKSKLRNLVQQEVREQLIVSQVIATTGAITLVA